MALHICIADEYLYTHTHTYQIIKFDREYLGISPKRIIFSSKERGLI